MNKQEAVNTFSDGLILDLDPLLTPSNTLTNCLNGTLLTYNGNENVLLNDMGNARVETAMLPAGYIPLGSTSFGGIIYIVSYNPIDKKYQIGSFPSPERNLSKDELGQEDETTIFLSNFCRNGWSNNGENFGSPDNIITSYYLKVNLLSTPIHPGDKYKIFFKDLNENNLDDWLSAYDSNNTNDSNLFPKYLKFDIVSTLEDGKTVSLTNNSVWTDPDEDNIPYYIYTEAITKNEDETLSLPEYRKLVGSNYDTYISKSSGLLGIVARLEVPTSFSVGYEIIPTNEDLTEYLVYFYINWANDNIKDKSRVNPNGIILKHGNDIINTYPIMLPAKDKELGEVWILPDAVDNINYLTFEVPPDYFKDDDVIMKYLEDSINISGSEPRRNDGSDFLYLMKGPVLVKEVNDDGNKYLINDTSVSEGETVTFDIIPTMPFGLLEFLKKTITIHMDRLYKGDLNLNNYQYYVDNNTITILFLLESYPDLGKRLIDYSLDLYPLSKLAPNQYCNYWHLLSIYSNKYFTENDILDPNINVDDAKININELNRTLVGNSIVIETPDPYNGLNTVNIDKVKYNLNIAEHTIYIVKFTFRYGTENNCEKRFFYRLLFNCNIFNNAFGLDLDFKDLYLYEEGKNYGISPKFNFTKSIKSIVTNLSEKIFPTYLESSDVLDINLTYKIEHGIESEFALDSGIEELKLNPTFKEDVSPADIFSYTIKASDDKIVLPKGLPVPSLNINDGELIFNNTILVQVPYIVEYKNSKHLDIYKLIELTCNYPNTIVLGHSSVGTKAGHIHENPGYFATYISKANNTAFDKSYIDDNIFYTPDDSHGGKNGKSFSLGSVEYTLRHFMDEQNYDYLTVVFGVLRMADPECGYGYEYFKASPYKYFRRFPKSPAYALAYINCIRSSDGAVLAHTSDIKLSPYSKDGFTGYNTIQSDLNSFFYCINHNIKVVKSDSKIIQELGYKYTKTSELKNIYPISNIDYIKDPTITADYLIKLLIKAINIKIENQTENQSVSLHLNTANNLYFNKESFIEIPISITSILSNQELINSYLSINFDLNGWDEYSSSKVLPLSKLKLVYTRDRLVLNGIVLNDNNYPVMSEEYFEKASPTTWYFGWENNGGVTNNPCRKEDIIGADLWYLLYNTYSILSLKSIVDESEAIDDSPKYAIYTEDQKFVKGEVYEFQVSRTYLPPDFSGEIYIACLGGLLTEILKFFDDGSPTFETLIKVRINSNTDTCKIFLDSESFVNSDLENIKEDDVLVMYTIENLLEPEPEQENEE